MPNRQEITAAIDALIEALDQSPGAEAATLRLTRVNRHHWTADFEIESSQMTADSVRIKIVPHKETVSEQAAAAPDPGPPVDQ